MVTSRNRYQCDTLPRFEGSILTVSREALSITEQLYKLSDSWAGAMAQLVTVFGCRRTRPHVQQNTAPHNRRLCQSVSL